MAVTNFNIETPRTVTFEVVTNLRYIKGNPGADGITPTIGANGNWFLGTTDTGKPSRGAAGAPGADGKDGAAGTPGKDGTTPHIGTNGNWYIGDTDTGVKAASVYYVDISGTNDDITGSKTLAEIKAAYEANNVVVARQNVAIYALTYISDTRAEFTRVDATGYTVWACSNSGAPSESDIWQFSQTARLNRDTKYQDIGLKTVLGAISELQGGSGVTAEVITNALGYTPVSPNQIVWATPEQYGAVGDGVEDDTDAINACLAANRNVIFAKTYRVKADKNNYNGSSAPDRYTYGVSVPSGRTLLFGGGAKLVCQTSNAAYSAALYLYGTSDVSIIGATIEGDRETNTLTIGEWGHGIVCRAANNVIIRDCTIYNCFGDGIVIGTSTATDENAIGSNICVENCKIYNNRRQGITVGGGKNITIKDCEIYEINGTAPQAGIDIEPNQATTEVSNVLISNCYFHDNATWDITNTNGAQTGIVIEDCRCNGKVNVGTGEVAICGGSYRGIQPIGGQLTISDVTVAQIFGNPQGTVVRSSKIIGNEEDSYTIAFDQDIGCDLTLVGCEITDVRNIIAKSTGIITFLDCKIVHNTDRSFSSQGHIRAFNTVFDFSDAAVSAQPINCATIELNNCDFYTAGNGPLLGINDETTAKDWINNRFHGSLTTLSYKANRLIKNFFNFSHTKIKSTATGARIGNVWSDLDEGATTDAEKKTWNNKQNAIPDLETIRTNAAAGAAKVSCTDATVKSYGYLKLEDLPKYEGGVS